MPLTLVTLFLIGLGLGDSPLVILSLCSLVLFFVISFLLVSLVILFSPFLFLFFFCSLLCTLCAALCFHEVFFNIIFLLIKKKKKLHCLNTIGADHTSCYQGSKWGQAMTIDRLLLGILSHTGREVKWQGKAIHPFSSL